MDKTIMFKISQDVISIVEAVKDSVDLNNTNIIDNKNLKFSVSYIKENTSLVSNFLNVVIIKNNIKTVKIENLEIAKYTLNIINSWENITNIIFKSKETLTLEVFLKILENKYIKKVECEDIPVYLLERIDVNKKVIIKTRNKVNLQSDFILDNMLNTYSDMYYKKSIVIKSQFDVKECIDFDNFMGINNRLKIIKLMYFSNEILLTIMEEIKQYNKENIYIQISEKNNDIEQIFKTIDFIRKKYRKIIEDNNINFKIIYSLDYKRSNLLKEVNYRILKYITILVFFVGLFIVAFDYYSQFRDQFKINEQISEFNKLIEDNEIKSTIDDNETDIEYIDINNVTTKTTKKTSNYVSSYYTNFTQVFETLLEKNNDTVGWLTVPETKINYPVVKAKTNAYYIDHDFYKKKNSMGWIFMDYRNDINELSQNTIIYGHNIIQGLMFGTLKYTLNSSWYEKNSNHTIIFNTIKENMEWKIFSIYKIPETDDYLKSSYENDEEFLDFIKKVKKRSIYDFKVDVNKDSKILTLSTCNNHVNRTVVHAVLIEKAQEES